MTDTTAIARDQLRTIVERIERLEEEKAVLAADIREVYAEAKGNGFDTKILRKVIGLRKKEVQERQEEEALLDLYMHALGMAPELAQAEGTPAQAGPAQAGPIDGGTPPGGAAPGEPSQGEPMQQSPYRDSGS